MNKEKNAEISTNLNILDTSFGEGMEMTFSDEYTENVNIVKEEVKEEVKELIDNKELEPEIIIEDKVVDKEEKSIEEESSLKVFASWLGDKGLVDFDEESFVDSEEGLLKLMSSTVENEITKYKESLPEDVHKLVEFFEAGGNPKDFINAYYNESSWSDYEANTEVTQKIVLREYLKAQGEDAEEVEETLDTYEISGILEKKAKLALTKLQNYEKGYQSQLIESQKKYDIEQKEKSKKQFDDFKSDFYSKDELQGFKLTPKLKDNLWDYMFKTDKTGKTGLQKHNEENKNAQYLYAYLAYNDWDLPKLERDVKTKINSELVNKLSNFKDGRSKLKSGQSDNFNKEKSENNFSAFKNALMNGSI